ncbi:gliding motility-associated C-terminal domain-containing protein [Lewinella sp. LCG006]|uniref:T9SS type B sorting domain-containing protein n=1 Tax=Lewinella sp. LCG006 TaxID=3231911 RepID=UPI003460A1E6
MRQRLVRLLLFSLLTVMCLSRGFAQNCGQRDTIIFTANSTASIALEISDYFNDDLSDPMQGLCGIELGFVHQFVENFELSLTSPAGQTVNLLGPNSDDPFAFTPGTQWQISLVSCAAVAQPDSAFTAQWNNNQTENWVPFGFYDGSYYPFGGCLEDFNTGPVNGTWTFNITNNPSNNPGAITYIRLIFCDSRGVECCFAQPGQWQNENLQACIGADTLQITPNINFPLGEADTLEYSYAFLISQDGIYQQLDSVLDLRTAAAGEYDICGFSYRSSQLDSLPLPDGVLTIDSIRSNLEGLEPWLCGLLTPECLHVSIIAPPDTTRLSERICRGDSIVVGGQSFLDSGFYTVDLNNFVGCDSIVTLDLFVQEVQFTQIDTVLCPGDTVFVGNTFYFETGFYRDTLASVELGCDSIVNLNLVVLAEQITPLTPVICAGESFAVGDSLLTTTGSYQILLTSVAGCDSLVSVDLLVLDPQANITGPAEISCAQPATLLNSTGSSPSGQLTFQWLSINETPLATTPTLLVDAAASYILAVSQEVSGTVCMARDTFVLNENFATPTADAGPAATITCSQPSTQIGGPNTSTGSAFTYQWSTTNGNITGSTNSPFTTVNSAGDYQLVVQDTFSSCTDTSTVNIVADQQPPTVLTGPAFTLNCLVVADTLDGSASLGPNISASWSGPCISNTPAPGLAIVDCPGWYFLEILNTSNGCSAVDSLLIQEDISPAMAAIAPADTLTCASTTVLLDGTPSTPTGMIDFNWIGPSGQSATTGTFSVMETGNYELIIVRQDNFCRDTATIIVAQDTLAPLADVGPNITLNCYAGTAVLRGNNTSLGAAYSYQWFSSSIPIPNALSDSLLVTEAGTYSLEVTDNRNGCTDTATAEVDEDFITPEDVIAGSGQLLACGGDLVQLVPDSTVFSNPVTWEWTADCITPQSDSWAIFTDCPGLYTLTVTNIENGCQGSDTTRVSLAPNFSIAILPDTAYLSCETGSVSLDNSGSIGSVFQWFLDDVPISLANNQPTVDVSGIYTLVTSDINQSCSDTAFVNVLIDCTPVAIIDPPEVLTCANQSIFLNGTNSQVTGPRTYLWTGPSASCLLSPTDAPIMEVVCPGEYQLIVEHSIFNLRDTTTITVLIDTVAPIVDAGPNQQITCNTTLANLQGTVVGNSNDFTFAWTPFFAPDDTLSQNINYTTNAADTYVFMAQNINNGCISTDVVQVTLNNSPPNIAFGSTVFPCQADTFRLRAFVTPAGGDYSYTWNGLGVQADANTSAVLINQTGDYTFSVVNNQTGCTSNELITVTEQTCVPCLDLLPVDTLDCLTANLDLEVAFCLSCEGCVLQWSDENGDLPGEQSLMLSVSSPGNYTLTAIDTLGFSNSVTATVLELTSPPMVDLGPDRMITCDSSSIFLQNLLLNEEGTYHYRWEETTLGDLPNSGTTLTVTEPGEYLLELTNLLTGCASSDTVLVTENLLPPVAEAGPNLELTCQSNAIALDGTGSTLSGVSYQWTGPNASCISGNDNTTPLVTCPGLYTLEVTNLLNGCTATDTVRVSLNEDVPVLTTFPDTVLTCSQNSITLVAAPPATGSFMTRWCPLNDLGEELSFMCTPNSTTLVVNTPGQYQYTAINDDTGCSNSFVVTVGIDTLPPMVEAGNTDTLFCTLNNLQLAGTGPATATYSWSNPDLEQIDNATSLQPIIYTPGWYFLEVQSQINGCTALDSVFIAEDENQPTLTMGNDTLINCLQPTVRLSASGMTFNGTPNWAWTTPTGNLIADASTPTPLVGAGGWYLLTLTDAGNGCPVTDSLFVSEDLAPPLATVEGLGNLQLNCNQDTLLLDGTNSMSSTGDGLAYTWRTVPPGSLFPDVLAPQVFTDRPGNYSLIVTDLGNGCRDTIAFNVGANFVRPIPVLALAEPITCSTSSSILSTTQPTNTADFQFLWTNENDETISNSPTAQATTSGWYYLVLTSNINGCSSRPDSVFVGSSISLPQVVVNTDGNISCDQMVVHLDGNGSSQGTNFSYQWSSNDGSLLGNGTNLLDSTQMAGTYTLTVMNNATGCANTDSVTVILQGMPISGLDVDFVSPPCFGDQSGSISINEVMGGSPPYLYQINGQGFSQLSFFEDLLPGNYQVQVVGSEGCQWEESITLTAPLPLGLNLGQDLDVTLGDSVVLTPEPTRPISTWKWNAPGLLSEDAPFMPIITPLETQFILLTVTDENGCTATDTLRIFVNNLSRVFIPTVFSPNGDDNNDYFTLYAGDEVAEIESLRIFSRWGNMVFEQDNFPPNAPTLGWDGTLWGEPLNPAVFVYYARIRYTDGSTELITGDVVLMK